MGSTAVVQGAEGFALFGTAVGACAIAWLPGGAIKGVQLPEDNGDAATRVRIQRRFPGAKAVDLKEAPSQVQATASRVTALLDGHADAMLDVPLDMDGVPPFHQRVYERARRIPPGQTLTYGAMAAELGEPGAARAVGQALGNNPFAPIVPCHRILAAGGQSGGFSAGGGVATKLKMLEVERAQFGGQPGLF